RRAARAAALDPLRPSHRWVGSAVSLALGDREGALDRAREAVALDPRDGAAAQRLGALYGALGDPVRAEALYRLGVTLDPTDPARGRALGAWLLGQGRRAQGAEAAARALALEPGQTRSYVTWLLLRGFTVDEIEGLLPDRAEAHLRFGDFREEARLPGGGEPAYRRAVLLAAREDPVPAAPYQRLAEHLRRQGRLDEAVAVAVGGAERSPRDLGLRLLAARLYEAAGISYRAAQEYEHALRLAPANPEARRGLARNPGDR
ncbi:MAG: tetratricopeptide repeat protein, partial [Deferrisomatales bacterium]